MSHAEPSVLAEIMNGRGSYFDGDVVDAFRACGDEFMQIARSHAE